MLALSPMISTLHDAHKKRRQRFAAAAARHVENIRTQHMSAQASLVQELRSIGAPISPPTPPVDWATAQVEKFSRPEPDVGHVQIRTIQNAVATHYGVTLIDMISARRTADLVRPRQVAMYLAKTLTLRSLPEIGRRFGGRDHTTVLHAVRKFEGLVARDASIAATVETLKVALA